MKSIVISDSGSVTSDIVDAVCNIDMTRDVVICCPHWKTGRKKDADLDVDSFVFRNYTDLRPNDERVYTFYPRVKMSVPKGLKPSFNITSQIQGLHITENSVTKIEGVELNSTWIEDEFPINVMGITGTYTLYTKFIFQLKEYQRALFSKNKFVGFRIPLDTNIINMYLMAHFFGENTFNPGFYGEVYLIYSNNAYQNFPNM